MPAKKAKSNAGSPRKKTRRKTSPGKTGPRSTRTPSSGNSRQLLRYGLGMIILIGLLTLGFFHFWRIQQLHAAIPAPLELVNPPPTLLTALETAREKADSWIAGQALEGTLNLARLYHANSHFEEAEACWIALINFDPDNAGYYYLLADVYRMTGDENRAEPLISRSLELDPEYAPGWLMLAEFAYKSGKFSEAEKYYRTRLELEPKDPYARLGLARMAIQNQNNPKAKEMLTSLLKTTPDFPSAHNVLAGILENENDIEGAEKHRRLARITGRFQNAPDPRIDSLQTWCYNSYQLAIWASVILENEDYEKAEFLLNRAVLCDPGDPGNYKLLARLYYQQQNSTMMIKILEQGISQVKEPSDILYNKLCEIYIHLNQLEKAMSVAWEGLAIIPESGELYNSIGMIKNLKGSPNEAIEAYKKSMEYEPRRAYAALNICKILLTQGKRAEAKKYLKIALEREPNDPEALIQLGTLEMEAGRMENAAACFYTAFDQQPMSNKTREHLVAWHIRATLAAARQNDPERAFSICQDGIELIPDSAELHGLLGVLHMQKKDWTRSRESLEMAWKLKPGDARIANSLADVYEKLSRYSDARSILLSALQKAREQQDAANVHQLQLRLRDTTPVN